jgi:transposase
LQTKQNRTEQNKQPKPNSSTKYEAKAKPKPKPKKKKKQLKSKTNKPNKPKIPPIPPLQFRSETPVVEEEWEKIEGSRITVLRVEPDLCVTRSAEVSELFCSTPGQKNPAGRVGRVHSEPNGSPGQP